MKSSPNILLITVDHWPGALLGCAGHPTIQTPTLDALAADGILFRNAYSASPTCTPARRSLHTGLTPRSHGDRCMISGGTALPPVPTLAESFRRAGYQTSAVGKMHVTTQARDRIGFEELLLNDEGRGRKGQLDDYELFLGDHGYGGQEFDHGMSPNEYTWRPWHLPEAFHVTNWTTRQMARQIARRDPTRPAFWFLSYSAPHPPLVPPASYLEHYREEEIDDAHIGAWAQDQSTLPQTVLAHSGVLPWQNRSDQVRKIRRAFYALCTHVDHQIRLILGTLREHGLLRDTIILFTSDHGDMLGEHQLWRKRVMYEGSANVPLILTPPPSAGLERGAVDLRLAGSEDVMPTLLELANLPVPTHVEGRSLVGGSPRDIYYSEDREGAPATRMVRDERYKLIYYADGNRRQLFDLEEDRAECHDLAKTPEAREVLERLTTELIQRLHGSDLDWLEHGTLKGLPAQETPCIHRSALTSQRGFHWPPAP